MDCTADDVLSYLPAAAARRRCWLLPLSATAGLVARSTDTRQPNAAGRWAMLALALNVRFN